jgi:hypothetical protein
LGGKIQLITEGLVGLGKKICKLQNQKTLKPKGLGEAVDLELKMRRLLVNETEVQLLIVTFESFVTKEGNSGITVTLCAQ